MCKPSSANICYKLQQQPLVKSNSTILLDSGCAKPVVRSSSSNPRKRTFNEMIKTAVFCGTCFVLLIVGKQNAFASPLVKLVHDIESLHSLDRLKKEFVDEELELGWDRQHIRELQLNIDSMKDSFHRITQTFHAEETDLLTKNESLREALMTTSDLNESVQKFDKELFLQLVRQSEKVRTDYDKEAAENAVLKKLLKETVQEMQQNGIPIPQAALRGSFDK